MVLMYQSAVFGRKFIKTKMEAPENEIRNVPLALKSNIWTYFGYITIYCIAILSILQ